MTPDQNPQGDRYMSHVRSSALFTLLAVAAVSFFASLGFAGTAAAEVQTSGSAVISLGTGKSGKALTAAKVSVSAVRPATGTRQGRITRMAVPAASVTVGSKTVVGLSGGVVFKRAKRKAPFSNMRLEIGAVRATVSAVTGGKRVTLIAGPAAAVIDAVEGRVSLSGAKVTLTSAAARSIRNRLKVKRLPAGDVGRLSASVRWTETLPPVDPYLEQCGLAATTRTVGTVPAATPLPNLTSPVTTSGGTTNWAVKGSLNGYINSIGSIVGLDGAVVIRPPGPPSVPPLSFMFQAAAGQLAANGVGTEDDQAVLNSTGTIVYCNAAHGFRIAISDPTVVIDGTNSRIIADVDTNISGDWMPTQRVDLVSLDLTGITATQPSPSQTSWGNVPTTLTQAGSDALRLCEVSVPGAPPGCLYPAGTAFAPITVTASTD
jgi:hypothetical protein